MWKKFIVIIDSKRKNLLDNISSDKSEHKNITGLPEISANCVYMSSNVQCETNRKTHGNQHY